MKSLLFVLIAAGSLSLVAPVQGADGYANSAYRAAAAPRPYYRSYAAPIPYRVYRPVYQPYAQGGLQGGVYVWGFPWRGGMGF